MGLLLLGSWTGGKREKGGGEEDRKKGYRKREKGQEVEVEREEKGKRWTQALIGTPRRHHNLTAYK
jgi:hypothetical protein